VIAWAFACSSVDGVAAGGPGRLVAGGGPVVVHETVPGWTNTTETFDQGDVASFQDVIFSDELLEVEIELPGASYDSLLVDPYTWVPANFVYEGVRYEGVGLRCKGENSFMPISQKCSLKVDFNKFDPELLFMGLDELTFNNMHDDVSMMHERIAYRMFREFGVPAARAGHALVTLNGEFYGLFAHVETVDQRMARQWFEDDSGTMFEVHDVDFYDEYVLDFSLEFGPDDRTEIIGTTVVVRNYDGEEALAQLDPFMSVDSFVDYWAVCAVVGQYDSYPYSWPGDDTHVYADPTSGQLVWLPHGVDETFYDPYRDPLAVNGVVAATCLQSADCSAQVRARVWDAQDVAESVGLLAYAGFVAGQIAPWVEADTNKNHDTQGVYDEQQNMRDFIANRRVDLEGLIGPP
jgi:hypothetical protein